MRAGALIYTVDIFKLEKTKDEYNSEIEKEILLIKGLRASRRSTTFDEGEAINQRNNSQRVEWRIRFRKQINEDCILIHAGNKYNIIGIDPLGRNMEMKLITTKI